MYEGVVRTPQSLLNPNTNTNTMLNAKYSKQNQQSSGLQSSISMKKSVVLNQSTSDAMNFSINVGMNMSASISSVDRYVHVCVCMFIFIYMCIV